jgi:GrpB-like predicted nucleotidyltransferase (UPF0157 family)
MTITIISYDPRWPDEFKALAQPMRARLGALATRIDHIGSTAVPGLAAKDRIDMQITVPDFSQIEQVIAILTSLGYPAVPHIANDHRPPGATGPDSDWEKAICSASSEGRPANIHIRAAGRPNQRYPLLFRDYLCVHPVAMGAYAEIKRQLARYHPDDVEFYYDIKDPVCDVIIDAAEDWAQHTGWEQGPSDS